MSGCCVKWWRWLAVSTRCCRAITQPSAWHWQMFSKKSNPWNSSLEYDWQYYIICLKQDSVHSCTDCMSSCLQVVETRQNSLVSVIDRIEFGGIMVEFLSNGYLRHCKDIFEEGWWNRKVLETVRQCVTQDLSRMTCYFVKIGNCLNI